MGGPPFGHDRRCSRNRVCALVVDFRNPQRRLEAAGPLQRDAVEADEMRRSDEHGDVEASIAKEPIRVARDRT